MLLLPRLVPSGTTGCLHLNIWTSVSSEHSSEFVSKSCDICWTICRCYVFSFVIWTVTHSLTFTAMIHPVQREQRATMLDQSETAKWFLLPHKPPEIDFKLLGCTNPPQGCLMAVVKINDAGYNSVMILIFFLLLSPNEWMDRNEINVMW